ncbi:MAG: hypothetical protein JXR88_02310 [Clostridia bacterium]|nr:hypothetical protein [Clostridia bacterium]
MKNKRSVIWIFAISYGLIMLLFFSTEKIENNTLPNLKLNYTKSSRGVDVNTFFDKTAVMEYASGLIKNPHMRLAEDQNDVIYRFSMLELEQEELKDLAETDLHITYFYDGYLGYNMLMNYFSKKSALLWEPNQLREFSEIVTLDTLSKIEDLAIDDQFLGAYDVYTIVEDNSYNPMSVIRGFYDESGRYGVMYHKATIFIDLDYDGSLDYSYHYENKMMVQTILLNQNSLYQNFYKVIYENNLEKKRWDITFDDTEYMILKQEEQ